MTAAEQRAKLTRLRDQVADLEADVHQLYVEATVGSRVESALASADLSLTNARVHLGQARDALNREGQPA